MKKKHRRKSQEKARLIDETTPFAIKEAFNQLRTNIMYSRSDDLDGCPVYGITSADIGAGKSTISANLALSFSQLGKKVLLVDADMRRPTQETMFGGEKNQIGLSELLSHIVESDTEAICAISPTLSLITSGATPPNPSELMLGNKIGELITKWRQEYDIVFIDLPPVGILTDPITISDHINGYIIVVTVNKSEVKSTNDAISQLKQVNKIVGMVINGAHAKGSDYSQDMYEYGYKYYVMKSK